MRIDGQLVCFNVFLEEETRIIGKYIGMRYPIAHQGAVMGPLFRTFGPMMAFDKMDPDLAQLGGSAPYLPATGTG